MTKRTLAVLALAMLVLFTVAATAQTYQFGAAALDIGKNISAFKAVDLNGDAIVDIVVANSRDNSVSVFLGKADASFSSPATYAVGAVPTALATADFNGDGKVDLAVLNENCSVLTWHGIVCNGAGSVSVLQGNGDGTFGAAIDTATGTKPTALLTGDFNQDNKTDIAVVNAVDGTMSILLGNGDLSFASRIYSAGNPQSQLDGTADIAVADFNGDHVLDVLYCSPGSISVLLGNGDGTFKSKISSVGGGTKVVTADFTSDGKLDLFTTSASGSTLMTGTGDGTFISKATFADAQNASLIATDLNADGKTDLIVTSQVWIGNGDGTFQAPVQYNAYTSAIATTLSDVNRDGRPDLLILDSLAKTDTDDLARLDILLGVGDGKFVAPASYTVGESPLDIVAADFNGDGRDDLATANAASDSVSVLLAENGTFKPASSYAAGHIPDAIATADLRGNHVSDLVVANRSCDTSPACSAGTVSVLLGNGDGSFQQHTDYTVGIEPQSIAIADFNSDNSPDIAVANYGSSSISVLLGHGDGSFGTQLQLPSIAQAEQVIAGDFNGDGKPDLLGLAPMAISFWKGYGDGTFGSRLDIVMPAASMAVGDFNGDGKLDVAVASLDAIVLLPGKGDGTFGAPVQVEESVGTSGAGLRAADFNGDGKLDLADSNSVWFGNGDGTFHAPAKFQVAPTALGNFNGDGLLDWADVAGSARVLLGVSFPAASTDSLHFGLGAVGVAHSPLTVTISNPNKDSFQVSNVAVTSADFQQTNDCGSELTAHGECTVSVTFSATATGTRTGSLVLATDTPVTPLTIHLDGTGFDGPYVTLSATKLEFGSQNVGTSSVTSSVRLTNSGNTALSISGVSLSGAGASDFGTTSDCGSSLAAGHDCTIAVTFSPKATGTRTATLLISDNANGGSQTVVLMGLATAAPDFTLGPLSGAATSQSVSAGQNTAFTLSLAPQAGFSATVALTCNVTPIVNLGPACSLPSNSMPLTDSAATVQVTINTTAATTVTSARQLPQLPGTVQLILSAISLSFGWRCRKKRITSLFYSSISVVLLFAAGCGGSSSTPPTTHTTPGTPAGTYTVTVTASSSALSHSTALNVIVQ